jgi:hypothetical protein
MNCEKCIFGGEDGVCELQFDRPEGTVCMTFIPSLEVDDVEDNS